jgi:hypothetical protein
MDMNLKHISASSVEGRRRRRRRRRMKMAVGSFTAISHLDRIAGRV